MSGRLDPAEALAYVDDCLDSAARSAFEARLISDPELRREVSLWESQNRAIRAAFGAPPRGSLDVGCASNLNVARRADEAARPAAQTGFRACESGRRAPAARVASPRRRQVRTSGAGRLLAGAAALVLAALYVGPPTAGLQPPPALIAAGAAAARALADQPVEFAADPSTLAARLGPRLGLAPPVASGLRLVGARLAPGSQTTAALYLYENARSERVALMAEPLDETSAAPVRRADADGVSLAAWTGAGYGFVAAAPDEVDVAALVAAAGVGAP